MSETERTSKPVQSMVATDASATCPHLGLLDDPETRALYARADHRCQIPGTTMETPDVAWQTRYCLSGRHGQCPIYRAATPKNERGNDVDAARRWVWAAVVALALVLIVAGGFVAMQIEGGDPGPNGVTGGNPTSASGATIQSTKTPTANAASTTPIVILAATPTAASGTSTSAVIDVTPTASALTATSTPTPEPSATPTPEPTPTPELPTPTPVPPAPTPVVQTYVIQTGDTLLDIATKFGVSEQSLIDLNQIQDPSFIQAGQVLKIPGP